MTNKTTFTLRQIALAATVFTALACAALPASQVFAGTSDWLGGGERVQGNGKIQKQTRALGHFTGVSLNLPATTELRIGNTESITIEADENILPMIEAVIEDGSLKIRPIKRNLSLQTRNMKIVVQAKDVNRIALGGSGSIDSDALRGSKLQFDLGGSGSIKVKGIEGDAVSVTLGGSGDFSTVGGKAGTVSISIGGSGDVDLGRVRASAASVSVAGSGEAIVWPKDSLSVTVAGSGDVSYYGDPKVSKTVVGSGGTRRLGDAPQ